MTGGSIRWFCCFIHRGWVVFFPFSYFTSNSGISRKKRSLTLLAYVLHHHRCGLKFQKKFGNTIWLHVDSGTN